jgi:hypothetical protein
VRTQESCAAQFNRLAFWINTMNTVNKWSDISKNIQALEKYRTSTGEKKTFYIDLIKRGTCYIAYQVRKNIHFAPSRFVGYTGNSLDAHKKNKTKDGRVTNKAIQGVLGDWPQLNGELEFEYKKFCQQLGFIANTTGNYGVARKFWFAAEDSDLLNKIHNASTADKELIEDLNEIMSQKELEQTEKERLISARVGQGWFRDGLISYWKKCAITKCDEITLLRASHIKPWRYSSNKEKLDLYNGLLLSPNLDLLFDKGFISFKENGEIAISRKLSSINALKLGVSKNMKIDIDQRHVPYLKWHKKNVFLK